MSLDIVWRILFAAYFCAAFVTPQLLGGEGGKGVDESDGSLPPAVHFGLNFGPVL